MSILKSLFPVNIFKQVSLVQNQVRNYSSSKTSVINVGRLHHVGIACPDIVKSAAMYRNILGAEISEVENVPEHGLKVIFVYLGNTKLSLLEPLKGFEEVCMIRNFLKRQPRGGIHHICVEVDDIKSAIAKVKADGRVKIIEPDIEPKIGASGNPVVFLDPKDTDGVLVEFEEVKSGSSN